jgi:hypothetical protein
MLLTLIGSMFIGPSRRVKLLSKKTNMSSGRLLVDLNVTLNTIQIETIDWRLNMLLIFLQANTAVAFLQLHRVAVKTSVSSITRAYLI